MKWVTRERPVIDRIACPWLIARFIDKQPEFLFVPPDQVVRSPQRPEPSPLMCLELNSPMWARAAVLTALYPSTVSTMIPPFSQLPPSFAALIPTGMTSRLNRPVSWLSPWVCATLAPTITRY